MDGKCARRLPEHPGRVPYRHRQEKIRLLQGKNTLTLENVFLDIFKKEGIRGLFLGWQLITVQSLSLATIFYLYDRLMTDYDQAIN
jgi:hypothetical protein